MVFLAHPYINIVSVVFLQYTPIIVLPAASPTQAEPQAWWGPLVGQIVIDDWKY